MFTGDNLRRRGYTIVGWCCMCQCSGSSFHSFFWGGGAHQLWNFVFRSFRASWVLSKRGCPFDWVEKLVREAFVEYLSFGSLCLIWII